MKPKQKKVANKKVRQANRILDVLKQLYPNPRSELNFSNEFQLVVAVTLSAQCTDKKVNEVTPELFTKFPNFKTLAVAKSSELERIIRPVNYYRTKAKNLIAMAQLVISAFSGVLPREHAQLVTLPGVGRKTANVVVGELGVAPALPVDTHVYRLTHRLALSSGKTVRDVENDLCSLFAPQDWRALHHSLILHGRKVCKAQRPACASCELGSLCPSKIIS